MFSQNTPYLKIFFSFAAEGVINKGNLKSFIKTLLRKKRVRLKKFTFHFLGTFFGVTLPVNRYEIASGYGLVFLQHMVYFTNTLPKLFQRWWDP